MQFTRKLKSFYFKRNLNWKIFSNKDICLIFFENLQEIKTNIKCIQQNIWSSNFEPGFFKIGIIFCCSGWVICFSIEAKLILFRHFRHFLTDSESVKKRKVVRQTKTNYSLIITSLAKNEKSLPFNTSSGLNF